MKLSLLQRNQLRRRTWRRVGCRGVGRPLIRGVMEFRTKGSVFGDGKRRSPSGSRMYYPGDSRGMGWGLNRTIPIGYEVPLNHGFLVLSCGE